MSGIVIRKLSKQQIRKIDELSAQAGYKTREAFLRDILIKLIDEEFIFESHMLMTNVIENNTKVLQTVMELFNDDEEEPAERNVLISEEQPTEKVIVKKQIVV